MNSLRYVCYTNQLYIPIANLFIKLFYKHTQNKIPLTVITNNDGVRIEKNDTVTVIDTNVHFQGNGGHFTYSLINALSKIDEKYIFFFCDDYFLSRDIDYKNLENLLNLMNSDNIDFFSFSSCHPKSKNWQLYQQSIFNDELFCIPDNFQYMCSVQPCIWRKETLLKVLEHNKGITLHDFDNSVLYDNKMLRREIIPSTEKYTLWQNDNIYGYKKLCSNFKAYDELDEKDINTFFIVQYVEGVRHGLFNIYLNVRGATFIKNILNEFNITSLHPTYGRFLVS